MCDSRLLSQSDSEDDYRTGCRNVSHCSQQQSYSGDYVHLDDHTQSTNEMTHGFKPFTLTFLSVEFVYLSYINTEITIR